MSLCDLASVSLGAGQLVRDQYTLSTQYADQAYAQALSLLQSLKNFQVDSVNTSTNFGVIEDPGAVSLPAAPEDPAGIDIAFTAASPGNLTLQEPDVDSAGTAPTLRATAPSINIPAAPTPFNGSAPSEPTPAPDREIPDLSLPAEPTAPAKAVLNLITVPIPDFPALTIQRPTLDPQTGDYVFTADPAAQGRQAFADAWSEVRTALAPYSSLAEVKTRMDAMLQGGTGLPAEVEQALFDRAAAREDRTALQAIQTANEEWSARGFSLPGSALIIRADQARLRNQEERNRLSREILIQVHTVEVENLRWSVQQGIALEGVLLQGASDIFARAVELVQAAYRAAVEIFNARVRLFEADLAAYRAEVEVYKAQIEAELSKLEAYRIRLEGEKIKSEVYATEVQAYRAAVEAWTARIEAFRAEVEGVKAQIEADVSKIEMYRSRVQAFGELVQAKRVEYDAYTAQVQAEGVKAQIYESQVRGFSAEVSAFAAKAEANAIPARIKNQTNQIRVQKFAAEVDRYRADLSTELARAQNAVAVYDGKTRIYAAQVGAETERFRTIVEKYRALVAEGVSKAELELKEAELDISQVQRAAQLEVQSLESAAQVASNLAAAALSAVNMQARIGEDVNWNLSNSCTTNVSVQQ